MRSHGGPGTVGAAVAEATERLAGAAVPDARLDAERLMAHVLDTDRGGVVARRPDPLPPTPARRYAELVARRERREPLQYLTGVQEFYGIELRVDRRALIPRPETEGIVDAVLTAGLPAGARVLDVGTGSGCIAVALAVSRSDLVLLAIDCSDAALDLARDNAARQGVEDRIEFRRARLEKVGALWPGGLDAVVSNPPYVAEGEWRGLQVEVRDHEPRDALVAGPTGVEAYRALAPEALRALRPGGLLVLELGYNQAARVREVVGAAGFREVEARPDLRGIPRVLLARR